MKVLYLLRHAKPVSPDGTRSDFDRPLSPDGRIQAAKVSQILLAERLNIPFVLSSPAVRAKETTEIVIENNGWSVNLEPRIYDAEVQTLVEVIRELADVNATAILIGHNPGMENLLKFLTGELRSMPTAGLAKMVVDVDRWFDCSNAKARLEWVVAP